MAELLAIRVVQMFGCAVVGKLYMQSLLWWTCYRFVVSFVLLFVHCLQPHTFLHLYICVADSSVKASPNICVIVLLQCPHGIHHQQRHGVKSKQ